LSRWRLVTTEDDDEVWELAEQVVEREWMDNGQMRWILDASASEEAIREQIPSLVSIEPVEPEDAEQTSDQPQE
jgi:hypothetical protein